MCKIIYISVLLISGIVFSNSSLALGPDTDKWNPDALNIMNRSANTHIYGEFRDRDINSYNDKRLHEEHVQALNWMKNLSENELNKLAREKAFADTRVSFKSLPTDIINRFSWENALDSYKAAIDQGVYFKLTEINPLFSKSGNDTVHNRHVMNVAKAFIEVVGIERLKNKLGS